MSSSVELVPFFELTAEDEDAWRGEGYVAGFRKVDGSGFAFKVALPAEIVEHAVMSKSQLSLSMNPDGTFMLHAEGLNDDALRAASREALATQSLQSLLSECLQPDLVAMEDDPIADLSSLRAQLAAGLALVDQALEAMANK